MRNAAGWLSAFKAFFGISHSVASPIKPQAQSWIALDIHSNETNIHEALGVIIWRYEVSRNRKTGRIKWRYHGSYGYWP